jgi:spoIIIJ-associated protein
MVTREFVGKTREEALEKAIETLKMAEGQFTVEYIEESSLLPFIKKKVTAKIQFDEEKLFGYRSLLFVKELLEKMNIEAKIYLIEENDEKVIIEIESPDTATIIGKNGQTLEAIQTIINSVMNRSAKTWIKIIIDIENYRNRRERNLKFIANKAVTQVRKTKKAVLLKPMTPFERRIIHIALQNEENIQTESIGEGIIKKIKINYVS